MPYYMKHVFMCTNQRQNGKICCADRNSQALLTYAKTKLQSLDCPNKQKIRINIAGCMNRCSVGPTLVIYPEGIWYHYKTQADIDEILESHIQNNIIVERLRLIDSEIPDGSKTFLANQAS